MRYRLSICEKKEIKGGKRKEKKKVQRSLEKRKTRGGEGKKN
jgi:hypothetical protein